MAPIPTEQHRTSCRAQGEPVSEIKHIYEIRRRKDYRGVDLISDVLPFGRLWYGELNHMQKNRSIRLSIVIPKLTHSNLGEAAKWLCYSFEFRRRLVIGALACAAISGATCSAGALASNSAPGPVIHIEDVDRFYQVYDAAGGHPTAEQVQHDYIDPGSEGLHQFVKLRNRDLLFT